MRLDDSTGIFTHDDHIATLLDDLRAVACGVKGCTSETAAFSTIDALNLHLRSRHSLRVCVTCANSKRLFVAELVSRK